jgi:thiamine biosynthesis protein ThiI
VYERCALIHYHEIFLKGHNRSAFESRLRDNLDFAVHGLTDAKAERISSRLLVRVTDAERTGEVLAACAAVPGVASVSECLIVERDVDAMARGAVVAMGAELERRGAAGASSFAVDARRSATDFATPSSEVNERVGGVLAECFGVPVRLVGPDLTVRLELVHVVLYVWARRRLGPGGLPVGTSGRVAVLLSAGIDSPVAAWRIVRRGAVAIGVHFSGAPQTSDVSTADVFDIAGVLAPVGGLARVYAVPLGDLQREIMLACPPDLRTLLYRRLMLRVAEAIAVADGAKALVTGDSLGQVASQTLDNIAAVDTIATMPVLRPLIGSDKQEIVAEARALGTYEISIRPHPDCCTLFMPRTPETHAKVADLDDAETVLDTDRMAADALADVRYRDFPCASYRPRATARGGAWAG